MPGYGSGLPSDRFLAPVAAVDGVSVRRTMIGAQDLGLPCERARDLHFDDAPIREQELLIDHLGDRARTELAVAILAIAIHDRHARDLGKPLHDATPLRGTYEVMINSLALLGFWPLAAIDRGAS